MAALRSGARALTCAGVAWMGLSIAADSYLVLRTELGEKMCWGMMGIFSTGWDWGQEIELVTECRAKGVSTYSGYCKNQLALRLGDSQDYNERMCKSTNAAKSMVITAASIGLLAVAALHKRLRIAGILLLASAALSLSSVLMVLTSPLFSHQHNDALSATETVGEPFNGLSCSFQTPLASHNPFKLFGPSPLRCLVLGPSIGFSFGAVICFSMALVFHAALPWCLPAVFQGPFSLYDSCQKKASSLSPSTRIFLVDVLPFCVMMAHVVQWLCFLWLGAQITGEMSFVVAPTTRIHRHDFALVVPPHTTKGEEFHAIGHDIMNLTKLINAPEQSHRVLPFGVLHSNIANVFSFSPVVSTGEFLRFGAVFVAVITVATILILPLLRVVLFVIFWFVPFNSTWRGMVLTLVDFSGKYMLANFFVVCVLGVAMDVKRVLIIPAEFFLPGVLPPQSQLEIRAKTDMTARSTGAWMLLVATFFALVLGQLGVVMHQLCELWEANLELRHFDKLGESVLEHRFRVVDEDGVAHRVKLTKYGRGALLGFLAVLFALQLGAVMLPLIRIEQEGFSGDFVVDPKMRSRSFSLVALGWSVKEMAGSFNDPPALNFALPFLLFCGVMHLARSVAGVWVLCKKASTRWLTLALNALEVTSAWASIEVLLLVLLILFKELPVVTDDMTSSATPKAAQLVLWLLPFEKSFFDAKMTPLAGFFGLVALIVFEKLVMHVLFALVVRAIADRMEQSEHAVLPVLSLDHDQLSLPLLLDSARQVKPSEAHLLLSPSSRYLFLEDLSCARSLKQRVLKIARAFGALEIDDELCLIAA